MQLIQLLHCVHSRNWSSQKDVGKVKIQNFSLLQYDNVSKWVNYWLLDSDQFKAVSYCIILLSLIGTTTIEKYDLRTNSWIQIGTMNGRRLQFGVAVIDNKLYIVGGRDGLKTSNIVECFNPITKVWTVMPPMSTHRHGLGKRCCFFANGLDHRFIPADNFFKPLLKCSNICRRYFSKTNLPIDIILWKWYLLVFTYILVVFHA